MTRGIALVLVGCVAGCSLVTTLDMLSEPTVADAGPDGRAPPPEPDGGDALDAGAFDATSSYCSKQGANLFCDDFDEKPLGFDWSAKQFGGGALTYEREAAVSAPNARRSRHTVSRTASNRRVSEPPTASQRPMSMS